MKNFNLLKLMCFFMIGVIAAALASAEDIPLPGPGAPPAEPPPTYPTPPPPPSPPPTNPTPPPNPPGQPGQDITYTLGSGQVGRFGDRDFDFYPQWGLRNLRALRLSCTNNKIKIKSVQIKFTNGRSARAQFLKGVYSFGDSRTQYLYGGQEVERVTVNAASSSIFKKNGAFRLDAAATVSKMNENEDH